MVLDESRQGDETVHVEGIDFVYEKNKIDLFDKTHIDFTDSWYGEGFVLSSPTSEPV